MKIHHYIAYRPEGRTNNYFRTYISPRNINSTSALSCHRVHLMCIRHYIAMISRRTLTATFQHDCSVWSISLAVHELNSSAKRDVIDNDQTLKHRGYN